MIIQREDFTPELYSELAPLLLVNCKEINNIFGDYDPNLETYFIMEMKGLLDFFIAREDNNIIGYMAFISHQHLHYKTKTVSVQDLFYVSPKQRTGYLGTKMLKFAESYLKDERHVDFILLLSLAIRDVSKIFKRQGYNKLESSFYKHIGGN